MPETSPAKFTLATLGLLLRYVTLVESDPCAATVAVSCTVLPGETDATDGVRLMDVTCGATTIVADALELGSATDVAVTDVVP
jgi:hypothetical protein